MNYLVDECLGHSLVAELRKDDNDVQWVREIAPGMVDHEILAWSVAHRRTLITEDFDFSDLIFRDRLPSYGTVIVQSDQFEGSRVEKAAAIARRLRDVGTNLIGHLTIVGKDRTKSRALPSG